MMHQNDVVFTTYQTLRSDWQGKRLLHQKSWLRVILDEGEYPQFIDDSKWILT